MKKQRNMKFKFDRRSPMHTKLPSKPYTGKGKLQEVVHRRMNRTIFERWDIPLAALAARMHGCMVFVEKCEFRSGFGSSEVESLVWCGFNDDVLDAMRFFEVCDGEIRSRTAVYYSWSGPGADLYGVSSPKGRCFAAGMVSGLMVRGSKGANSDGHLRKRDLLKRWLEFRGFKVSTVSRSLKMNHTAAFQRGKKLVNDGRALVWIFPGVLSKGEDDDSKSEG